MKRLVGVRVILVIAGLLTSAGAFASHQSGKVTRIIIRDSDGLIYFYMDGAREGGKPACATHPYWMIRNENSETAKRQLAILMSARMSGMPITVIGSNLCTRWGDGEDVNEIQL